jgi:hypothetical protein
MTGDRCERCDRRPLPDDAERLADHLSKLATYKSGPAGGLRTWKVRLERSAAILRGAE